MTAIAPNTIIKFGTTYLPNDYSDTYHFDSLQAQLSYMNDNLVHVYTKFTYQREHRNFVKIEINSEQEADKWDYMMFQNTSYGNKWFFAFITETEWINNLTVKIYYEIDYIQTYYFEYHELQCFIERTHTDSDNIGENIVPETLEVGEYITNDVDNTLANLDETSTVILLANDGQSNYHSFANSTFFGGEIYIYDNVTEDTALASFLNLHATDNRIRAVYTIPNVCRPSSTYIHNNILDPTYVGEHTMLDVSIGITPTSTLDGYTPKNKKLYTYPYSLAYITDNGGNSMVLRYEFIKSANFKIDVNKRIMPPACCIIKPRNYKVATTQTTGFEHRPAQEAITLTGFPLVAWSNDSYQYWQARSLTPMTKATALSMVGSAIGGMMTGSFPAVAATATNSVFNYVSNVMTEGYKASMDGTINKGNFNSGGSNVGMFYRLIAARMSVTKEYAQMIDDYFTMFGYAMKKLDIPSRKNRTRFTYVKTVGCIVTGDLPSGAKKKIQDCYNNGIRFWADYENYGSYENNQPLY